MRLCLGFGLAVAGCAGTTPADDDSGTAATAVDDDDDAAGGGDCAGTYDGTYDGADQGSFEATIDPVAGTVDVVDVDGSGGLEGVLDLHADGTIYGESQGYWMDGTLDAGTCAMSGTWGVIAYPGVSAGTWRTTP